MQPGHGGGEVRRNAGDEGMTTWPRRTAALSLTAGGCRRAWGGGGGVGRHVEDAGRARPDLNVRRNSGMTHEASHVLRQRFGGEVRKRNGRSTSAKGGHVREVGEKRREVS
eukprot:353925-Chlamydomonas_euryale.AAC.9